MHSCHIRGHFVGHICISYDVKFTSPKLLWKTSNKSLSANSLPGYRKRCIHETVWYQNSPQMRSCRLMKLLVKERRASRLRRLDQDCSRSLRSSGVHPNCPMPSEAAADGDPDRRTKGEPGGWSAARELAKLENKARKEVQKQKLMMNIVCSNKYFKKRCLLVPTGIHCM